MKKLCNEAIITRPSPLPSPPSQAVLTAAGKEGKATVFLLTDTQIKEEAFLEDVDGLLNAGEVANLFALDEKQEILEVGVVRDGAN